ncbi:MAG: TetR/AcrR family transcriptional regulator [Acidimicrobiia bacterium]|nr:MAG: TetR/AcrR family transcriptional regulator [Acidimicrobiia bacterium]
MATEERQDRRVRRTKQRLQVALMALIAEKSYDKITVQDLIDRADVGRSTFYAHYETKDDLLVSGLDGLTADIELHLADEPAGPHSILPSMGLFRHVAENHRRFKPLFGSRGIDLVMNAAYETLVKTAMSRIDELGPSGESSDIPKDARAAFAAGSLMAFLTWWIDNDMPYSPEQMADMYARMTANA